MGCEKYNQGKMVRVNGVHVDVERQVDYEFRFNHRNVLGVNTIVLCKVKFKPKG